MAYILSRLEASVGHRIWNGIVLMPLVVGCSESGAAPRAAVIRDSAGITIVQNPPAETAPVYAVSGPVLQIGEVSGAEEYELHRVAAVVPLSDGSVAVAVGGTEIRWYDGDGRFLRRAGREGGGPGEFRTIRYMRSLRGDSLLLFDARNLRVTWFSSDGTYIRDETPRLDDDRPSTVAAALGDGTLLIRRVLGAPGSSTPLYRAREQYVVRRGDTTQALTPYPGPETALDVAGSGGDITSVFLSILPFARRAYASAGPDRFFVGSSDTFQVDVWNRAGQLVRIVRVDMPVRPVTDDLLQAYIDGEIERRRQRSEQRGQSFNEAEARQQLRERQHAPSVPAYGSILATADGGLWVQDYAMPGTESAPLRWTIFDAEGRIGGVIDVPARFTPLYVEGDVVWGVLRDSLDVPHVQAYTFGDTTG